MKTREAADVLRNLIQTLEDGKEGFRLAADAIDNSDLKKLFTAKGWWAVSKIYYVYDESRSATR
jgi:hypothetical protein